MPSSVGPNIKGEENLVFSFDTGDIKNSYKGEPTTNIVPAPERNSRFTTSNSWYTYNTAQYNGNTYFNIGTIGSVIDNEVTMASVSRTLYDFDCLRAQTTGGGVTAGTDYFVKKTGTNSFTLHAYNGSQDGSQGYIDISTGTFKVHESVALDQRVDINDVDFPTMWWGSPHKPNMCYVKEVVPSGGPNDNSSFMRIHLTRPAGTDGGMAYGVYPQVTQGDVITLSFWARSSIARSWSWSSYFNAGFSAASGTINSTTEWQRFEYTWTSSNTFGFYMYFWPGNPGVVPYYVDLADLQVEINKGHATPFTLSSRSNTEALLDLTGNSTIDLSNVSFDVDAEITFDGTNDYITVPHNPGHSFTGDFSIEAVIYPTGNTANCIIQKGSGNDYYQEYWLLQDLRGSNRYISLIMGKAGNGSANYINTGAISVLNQYHHIVATVSGTTATIYVNGVQQATGTISDRIQSSSDIRIGWRVDGFAATSGSIPLVKLYSKALSEGEALANYNAVKSRFNI